MAVLLLCLLPLLYIVPLDLTVELLVIEQFQLITLGSKIFLESAFIIKNQWRALCFYYRITNTCHH